MLYKTIILILSYLLLNVGSFAQEIVPLKTALYVELVGKGFFSANVDFSIGPRSRLTLGLTMLDHEFPKEEYETDYPTQSLPTPSFMYLHLFGQERHFFEAGFGVSVSPVFWKEYSENDSALSLHGCLGYRYQASKKILFRAGFTPFYRVNWVFLPLVGVSIGYSF